MNPEDPGAPMILALFIVACATEPPVARETPAPPPRPVEVDPVARRVVERAGNPYSEPGLSFTFEVDGRPVRWHRWDVSGGRAEVTWVDQRGSCTVVTPVPYAGEDPLQKQAWSYFVNDQYWLLAPSKVLDPGVEARSTGDVLELSFASVGLTPGDRYRLTVDPEGDVTAWDFTLQSGRSGRYSWSEPVGVGGLRLSLERTSGDRTIRFTGVRSEAHRLGLPGGGCI